MKKLKNTIETRKATINVTTIVTVLAAFVTVQCVH